MSDLLYTVFTNITPAYEDEFNEWQVTEHVPFLMGLPGYESVIRYKDLDTPHRFTNFWHIREMSCFENPERLVRAKTPWGNKLSPFRNRRIDFYVQDGGLQTEPSPSETAAEFKLLIMHSYSDKDDKAFCLTENYRKCLEQIKSFPHVMDARIYHSYEGKGIEENCVFFYLDCSPEEAEKGLLEAIDQKLDIRDSLVRRTRLLCLSKTIRQNE